MATSNNPNPIADPEEFEKESKRVTNKLRSDLDSLIVPEDSGIPLLRYDATLHVTLRLTHERLFRSGRDYQTLEG
jgi:hypothetical protein